MNNTPILTCVFCSLSYLPCKTHEDEQRVVLDHAKACPKHPLAQALSDAAKLRKALVLLVGVDGHDDLLVMGENLRQVVPDPNELLNLLYSVQVLIETLPAGA